MRDAVQLHRHQNVAAPSFLMRAARAAVAGPWEEDLVRADVLDVPAVLHQAAGHHLTAFVIDALGRTGPAAVDAMTRAALHDRLVAITTGNLIALSTVGSDAVGASAQVELMLAGRGYELSNPLQLSNTPDAIPATIADRTIRVVPPERRLLELCEHRTQQYRLDVVLAAALIAALKPDWDAIAAAASARGCDDELRLLLELGELTLGSPNPLSTTTNDRHRMRARELYDSWHEHAPARRRAPAIVDRGAELWIAGFPSPYGGADTELDHQIDLLRGRGVAVHLVPMFGWNEETRESVESRGCAVHDFEPDIFRDKIVASYCNGEFLRLLPLIVDAGRPAKIIWFNCMTWLFDAERDAHRNGWIDVFGFQSSYQRHMLSPQLERLGPVRTFPYRPYFNLDRVPWTYRTWNGSYCVGRISRDDAAKYAPDTWELFDRVTTPPGVAKKVCVLGYGDNAAAKIGPPPAHLDCAVFGPGAMSADDFFRSVHTIIHKTGGSRENYSRVLVEAYAYGVVPIVERDFGFPELVVHGETGFMSSDSATMSAFASELAADPPLHRRMAEQGRRHLQEVLASEEACWQGWRQALDLA